MTCKSENKFVPLQCDNKTHKQYLKNQDVMKLFELKPMKSSRKSFYGKAIVKVSEDGTRTLQSYTTDVVRIKPCGTIERFWDGWSATTGRHIAEFCGLNKKEYFELTLQTR